MNARRPSILFAAALAIGSILATGCASTSGTGSLSPQQQAALAAAENVALNAGLNALVSAAGSYAATGKVNTRQLAADSIYGGAQQLRTLIATQQSGQPAAVQAAVQSGSTSSVVNAQVAPAVAGAVQSAIRSGAPPDLAVEAAARGLDAAAAKGLRAP